MATINFSISEELKEEFQTTFEKENRSALIAQLMRKAIEERKQQARRSAVIASILDWRAQQPAISPREARRARQAGRP